MINMEDNKRAKIIEKLNDIQEEILEIGWNGIQEKYHPDVNVDDPEAFAIYKLYKHIYEKMQNRIKITEIGGDISL